MNIVVMPGDDIGPEIVAAAVSVLKEADKLFSLGVRLADVDVGMASFRKHGTTLTDAAVKAALDALRPHCHVLKVLGSYPISG